MRHAARSVNNFFIYYERLMLKTPNPLRGLSVKVKVKVNVKDPQPP